MKFQNIPAELRELPCWCVAGKDKIPLYWDGEVRRAKVDDWRTWMKFTDAMGMAGWLGEGFSVGFVLNDWCQYSCIDIDVCDAQTQEQKGQKIDSSKWTTQEQFERYWKIAQAFDTYTELSRSGKGLHIWVKGKVDGGRRDGVELYSTRRFIICTGEVVIGGGIKERKEYLEQLGKEIKRGQNWEQELEELEAVEEDAEIWKKAVNAENGDKFVKLCEGQWMEFNYPSQSEADLALMAMICFWTKSNEQVRRMFRQTVLGSREKAKRDDYLNRALKEIRGKAKIEELECELAKESAENFASQMVKIMPVEDVKKEGELEYPPGMVGQLARFIYGTLARPVKEIAIITALAYMSGVCSRAYNINRSGLNLYLVLLAASGVGKEGINEALSWLTYNIGMKSGMEEEFAKHFVFGDYASGTALKKDLAQRKAIMNVTGEFGQKLRMLLSADGQGGSHLLNLKKEMLELYQKSGQDSISQNRAFADKEKEIANIKGAAFSMIGESTITDFYEVLTDTVLRDGFLSRFDIIEYRGKRNPLVMEENRNFKLPELLEKTLVNLAVSAFNRCEQDECDAVKVEFENRQAFEKFNAFCDEKMNESDEDAVHQIWNRAGIKVMKIAALLAIGDNHLYPKITNEHLEWAKSLVMKNVDTFLERLRSGDIGRSDASRVQKLIYVCKELFMTKNLQFQKYKEMGIVPRMWINKSCYALPAFAGQSKRLVDNAIMDCISTGFLKIVPNDVKAKLGIRGDAYYILGEQT